MKAIGVTRCLALAGVADFSWSNEEAMWKGSEIHRACELLDKEKLDEKRLPESLRGYLLAYKKFKAECHFVPLKIEVACSNLGTGLRGRADRVGLLRGRECVLDIKTGPLNPAVGLQLALYGNMMSPIKWWHRVAVQLKADGHYSCKHWDARSWLSDLVTAQACVRIARWRVENTSGLRWSVEG